MSETPAVYTASCPNCGHALNGPFCAHCGQQVKEVKRPFLYILQEIMRVLFELDGRAYRSVFYLLTRPGFLTREYFSGRRVSYTPPLRLFLIVSIGFFLLVSVVTSLQSMRNNLQEDLNSEQAAVAGDQAAEEDQGPEVVVMNINGEDVELPRDEDGDFSLRDLEEFRELTANISLPFVSAETNSNFQRLITLQVEDNINELMEDPSDFLLGSLEYLTFFMLLMMPILALIQRALFFFNHNFYIEHLVLTLHNHTFLILIFFLTMVLGALTDLQIPVLSGLSDLLGTLVVIWMFLYLYLSLKFYFGRGYMLSALLFLTTSILYTVVLSLGIAVFALMMIIFS